MCISSSTGDHGFTRTSNKTCVYHAIQILVDVFVYCKVTLSSSNSHGSELLDVCPMRCCGAPIPSFICFAIICLFCRPLGSAWRAGHAMRADGHKTEVRQLEEKLWGFSVEPKVGIGQRSLLVVTRATHVPPVPPCSCAS